MCIMKLLFYGAVRSVLLLLLRHTRSFMPRVRISQIFIFSIFQSGRKELGRARLGGYRRRRDQLS